MKRGRVIAASAAFVGLALTKMLFPNVGDGMRTKLQSALEREAASVAAFRSLERRLNLGKTDDTAAPEVTAQPTYSEQYVSYYVEDALPSGEKENAEEPEIVAAFLARQAEFAGYALPENVDYGYSALPFAYTLPLSGRQSSGFGYRLHPILETVKFHYGTDVAAQWGETVAAFADGCVTEAGYDDSYGWHLKLDHGGGWVSHYCHCSRLLVKEGQSVTMGEAIALVGATGLATGPHLHFELTRDGVYVNPEYYLDA